jgi:hypothetical protein
MRIIKISIFFIFFNILFIQNLIFGQVTEKWVQRYNGLASSLDIANYIVCTPSGNIAVTGMCTDTVSHNTDVLTIMYSPSGNQIWKDSYNGTGNNSDYGTYITTDLSGNIIIAGSSIYQSPGYGALLIKYNSSGIRQWVIRDDYQGEYRFGMVVKTDDSGNIYLGTKHGTFASGTGKITKYNPGGTFLWNSQPGRVYDILITKDGYIYAGGTRNFKYFLNKYNRSGVLLFADTLNFGPGSGGGVLNDGPCYLASDSNNNIYLTGFGYPLGAEDIYTLKISPSGEILWEKSYSYNIASAEMVSAILVDSSGNVYVGGTTDKGNSNFYNDYLVLKYSNSGNLKWAGYYDGAASMNDNLSSIVLDYDNNVIATGSSYQNSSGDRYDITTVKFGDTGGVLWEKKYDGPNDSADYATHITSDNNGNFYVAGGSGNYNSGLDFVTIKYSGTTNIKIISLEIPQNFILYQNFPNPFNPETHIKFEIPRASNVKLEIFDITGKILETLVDENLQPGIFETEWNANSFASGIYFYRIIADNFVQVKKMILIK